VLEKCNKNESKKPLKQMKQEQDNLVARLIENLTGSISVSDRLKMTAVLTSEMFLNRKTQDILKMGIDS